MSVLSAIRKLKSRVSKFVYSGSYPPGHFYSPIPDLRFVRNEEKKIFNPVSLGDIELNEKEQLIFLQDAREASTHYPFPPSQSNGYRYYYNNTYFNITDSLSLFLILDRYKSKKIIEVGSGFSSACILDTYEKHLKYTPELVFIEPYADRLKSLLSTKDMNNCSLIETVVQHVEPSLFASLEENDILFIDSSHISKVGSDLNYLLFEVLPVLKKGVIIHFHDICYPFEYPKEWIYDGIYWNEAYLVRAFLMNNSRYEIVLFNHFVAHHHRAWLDKNMPQFQSGGSLWLRKK